MKGNSVFNFVHIRPTFVRNDYPEQKVIANTSPSNLLKKVEKEVKDNNTPFEIARLKLAKNYIYSKDFVVKSELYNNEKLIKKIEVIIMDELKLKDFEIHQRILSATSDKKATVKQVEEFIIGNTFQSEYSKLWDSYYALKLYSPNNREDLFTTTEFWIKTLYLFKLRDKKEALYDFLKDFKDYKLVMNLSFYTHDLLYTKPKDNTIKSTSKKENRTKKIDSLRSNINELSYLENQIKSALETKRQNYSPPIQPEIDYDIKKEEIINIKELENYQREVRKYNLKYGSINRLLVSDFSSKVQTLIKKHLIMVSDLSPIEIEQSISDQISLTINSISDLSFEEVLQLKNGHFIKSTKRI